MNAPVRCFQNAVVHGLIDIFRLHLGYRAAALTFYTIIALIPLLVVITTILSILPYQMPELTGLSSQILPSLPVDIIPTLKKVGSQLAVKRQTSAVIGFLLAYFFASKLFVALHRTLKLMFEAKGLGNKHLIVQLLSIPFIILALILLYLIAVVSDALLSHLSFFPLIDQLVPEAILIYITDISHWLTFSTFFLLSFSLFFFLVPRPNRRWGPSLIMSVVAGGGLYVLKSLFAALIIKIASINPIYGAFGGIFGLLTWISWAYIVILVSARILFHLEKSCNNDYAFERGSTSL